MIKTDNPLIVSFCKNDNFKRFVSSNRKFNNYLDEEINDEEYLEFYDFVENHFKSLPNEWSVTTSIDYNFLKEFTI